MNDTPTSPEQVDEIPLSAIFIAFHFRGRDNGVPKEGFDSRVVNAPVDVKVTSAEDVKIIADTLANSEFQNGRKFEGLEITILNIVRLPI